MTNEPVAIDLHQMYQPDSRCVARVVWQHLFNTYVNGGGDLRQMDNLLLDYDGISRHWEEGLRAYHSSSQPDNHTFKKLFWSFEGSLTQLIQFRLECYDQVEIRMEFDLNRIVLLWLPAEPD